VCCRSPPVGGIKLACWALQILIWAGRPGLDLVSDLDLASFSIPLEPSSALALLPEQSSLPPLVSDAGLESLEAGVLGVISGPADVGSGSVPSLGLVPSSVSGVADKLCCLYECTDRLNFEVGVCCMDKEGSLGRHAQF
jgi:hypothetical protein